MSNKEVLLRKTKLKIKILKIFAINKKANEKRIILILLLNFILGMDRLSINKR